MKKLSKTLFFLICGLLIPLNYVFTSYEETVKTFSSEEVNLDKYEELNSEIIEVLENYHYTKKKYPSLKDDVLKDFIEKLDPNRSIFLESEFDLFINKEKNTDPYNHKLSIENALNIFNLYKSRYEERYQLQKDLLKKINLIDLKQNKKIYRDQTKNLRVNDLFSLNLLWEDILTNDVIQLSLNGNDLSQTSKKLNKRLDSQLHYFNQTKTQDIFDLYFNSIASSYGPHTAYMSPKRSEDFDIDMKLSLEGIGALLTTDGMYTSISSLVPGGPAEKSNKLKSNAKIIGVAQENEEILTDIIGWRIDDVVQLIRGPKNTKVKLEIIPSTSLDESQTKVIEITRNVVMLEDQAANKRILNIKNEDKEIKVGVIELPAFYMDFDAYQKRQYNYRSSSKDVKNLIKSLKKEGVEGLIIDLRNNGGGSLMEANALAHLFLGGGVKVQVKTSRGNIHSLGERRGFQFYDGPLVVLVNRFSASASEILAGAIQDYNRGLVLGTDTFGKGTVQRVENISEGQLKFTESKFYRVSGKSTQNKGVSPDIYLPTSIDSEDFGENKLTGALGYDVISKVKVKNFNLINISKQTLASNHLVRAQKSILFNHYEQIKKWRKTQKEDLFLDLNIDKRREKKEKMELELLTIENKTRKKLGLPSFETYSDFLEREEQAEKPDLDEEILFEAANVLSDLFKESYNPVISMNRAG